MHPNELLMIFAAGLAVISGVVLGLRFERRQFGLARTMLLVNTATMAGLTICAAVTARMQGDLDPLRLMLFWLINASLAVALCGLVCGTTLLFRKGLRRLGLALGGMSLLTVAVMAVVVAVAAVLR